MATTTGFAQTVNTDRDITTASVSVTPPDPVPLIDLILSDINALLPHFNGLVSSYRLLVGAAEEIHRTPEICPDVFERAVVRFDNAGTLLDVLLELLCCKIIFSSDLLQVTGGPVDFIRHLLSCLNGEDTPCRSAQTIAGLAALRRLQSQVSSSSYCFSDHPVVCPRPPAPPSPPIAPPSIISDSDISDLVEAKVIAILNQSGLLEDSLIPVATASTGNDKDLETEIIIDLESPLDLELETEADLRFTSRLRPKHLPDMRQKKRKNCD